MAPGIVIVGAGLAGVSAAEALRSALYQGPITLFDDEGEWPYDRPPLSKAFLAGEAADTSIHLRPPGWYDEQRIVLRRGVGVTALDPAAQRVTAKDGAVQDYDKLLLATGASARRLPGLPERHPRLLALRSLADAQELRAALRPGSRIILIGGGVIGMECAATAVRAGCAVTVLEAGPRIMARFFPAALSTFLASRHEREGVVIRTGFMVDRVMLGDTGVRVTSSDGVCVDGDYVIAGIGAAPNIALAQSAGLRIAAGGIAVDAFGRTSAPGIYAAGDCAAFPGADGMHARWENWTHAIAHAQLAARAMIGDPVHYHAIPWVWSDQYDLNIQVTGAPDADQIVLRGDMAAGRFTLFHLRQGRIVGGTTVNNGRDKRPLRALVAAAACIPADQLADTRVPLKPPALADAP
jgi:NADPH-dependent 2,4-dienoyl-CoA reductase/sulfur reductase-like enzyme